MSFYSKEQKQEIYRKWVQKGRPWFSIDGKNDPTAEERSIILEMKQRESNQIKSNMELEKRSKEISKKYNGKLSDSVFDDILLRKELDDFTKTRNKGHYSFRFEHVEQ